MERLLVGAAIHSLVIGLLWGNELIDITPKLLFIQSFIFCLMAGWLILCDNLTVESDE